MVRVTAKLGLVHLLAFGLFVHIRVLFRGRYENQGSRTFAVCFRVSLLRRSPCGNLMEGLIDERPPTIQCGDV